VTDSDPGIAAPRRARRRKGPAEGPTTSDPVEIAMEALKADGSLQSPAREVLLAHTRLLNWQIASERMTVALKALTAAAGIALALGAGWLVYDASRYQGLVVEAFSAPPDLAARGLTGEAMAGQMLDKLVDMQAGTDSVRAPGSYAIDWGKDVEVQIPETGVSIGELQKFLREWLGKETRISGVVFRTGDGLAVTARTAGAAGATFTGAEADLEGLMQKTAETVYRRTQPYRFAVYLQQHARDAELDGLLADDRAWPAPEQKWRQRFWGFVLENRGEFQKARAHYRESLALDPDMSPTLYALGRTELALGHEQASLETYRRAVRLFRQRGADQVTAHGLKVMLEDCERGLMTLTGDNLGLARARAAALADSARYGGSADSARISLAEAWTGAHDIAEAERVLAPIAPQDSARARDVTIDIARLQVRAAIAVERDDPAAAVPVLEEAEALARSIGAGDMIDRALWPVRAYALARAGRPADAQALAAKTPLDCSYCLRQRGRVASLAGDWRAADRWFAEAVRLAPDIPHTYADWGESLLARGRPEEAIDKFERAHKLGPRFAEPLQFWGEALLKTGDTRGALRKFEAARPLAPAWKRNRDSLAAARARG
jgi:tetratricopeptide (TPR) repeat protein